MKTIITIVVVAALAFANQPSAQADDKTRAIIGGVIGGMIIGAALDNDKRHHRHVEVRHTTHRHVGHYDDGYYKWVTVRVWVPGKYHYRYDDCGRRYKVWSRGYYDNERKKVWVSYNSRRGHYDDRHYHSSRSDRYRSCDF
ncbi:MAG: hypothetical protein AAGB46_02110 [Verrucomicrobiota bacterium]